MASTIPYTMIAGTISKIFEKIQLAKRPDRFTQDFLSTKLSFPGGNRQAIIPLLKRMGFLGSDGSPTALYDKFRNHTTQGAAVAEGIKRAYSELYDRNEYAHEMTKDQLTGEVTEITGFAKGDRTTRAIVSTYLALKDMADFDAETDEPSVVSPDIEGVNSNQGTHEIPRDVSLPVQMKSSASSVGFNVAYTINLNLPETTDPEVFNAIFKALKENLL